MEESKGKIGLREFVAIIFLTVGPKYGDDSPTILYKYLDTAAWMAPIIISILSIIPIYFMIKVLGNYEEKNLSDVIRRLFGKYIGFIILMILWIILICALTFDTAIYSNIITTMYFSETPLIAVYVVLMAVCAYGAKKGLQQIGSVSWAVLFWIKLSLLSVLIIILFRGEFSFLFPIFGPGPLEVVKDSSMRLTLYAEFLYLGLIYPYLSSKRHFKKAIWITLPLITVEITIAIIGFILLFDYVGVKMMNYPFHEAIRYLELGFLINIETFFFPFWLIATFVRFTFYLYLASLLFGDLFKIKHFEYLTPILATLVFFLGLIPESPTFTIFYLREKLLTYVSPLFFLLPIIIWILAVVRGEFKNDKTKNFH
ncbi:endospore germination permease [Bacillus sp. S/N-304-OC-R1]|uniref:GerAB/ArcD/ProY family transporter n=1 Tax=Bacillus sp. S/N-304-OC-R1 TaxID=2758034 RepID=UPI001C8E194F|nr:endospore germination permease [Bacillus sp. S/N-304-OC-R1]MBY0121706.1 endospore germination permease [Bacillus sp. S/N-304-OC-R1]